MELGEHSTSESFTLGGPDHLKSHRPRRKLSMRVDAELDLDNISLDDSALHTAHSWGDRRMHRRASDLVSMASGSRLGYEHEVLERCSSMPVAQSSDCVMGIPVDMAGSAPLSCVHSQPRKASSRGIKGPRHSHAHSLGDAVVPMARAGGAYGVSSCSAESKHHAVSLKHRLMATLRRK